MPSIIVDEKKQLLKKLCFVLKKVKMRYFLWYIMSYTNQIEELLRILIPLCCKKTKFSVPTSKLESI